MLEAESDGIEPSCFGEFVHKGFDGEDVAVGAQRPERSVADWSVKEEMIPDLLSRQFIGGANIAVPIAERQRALYISVWSPVSRFTQSQGEITESLW